MNRFSHLVAVGDNQEMLPIILTIVAVAFIVLLVALIAMLRRRKK